jgi:hypothetical protein
VLGGLGTACSKSAPEPLATAPLVVVAADDAGPWVRVLRAEGLAARVGTLDEATGRTSAVIPTSVDLVAAQLDQIETWLERGGRLVTAHRELLEHLGYLRESKARVVPQVEVEGLGPAQLPEAVSIQGLRAGKKLSRFTSVARGGGLDVQALSEHGDGKLLALAADPFDDERIGHELFPWLGRQVAALTGAPAGPKRVGGEVYFDPGALRGSPGDIAEVLADVRAVHVAGWNYDFNDPANDYDYTALIDALHAKGVLVYAWLEPPFVTLRFWDDHPQCRERTASGREAHVDWRKLIALHDQRCFEQAWASWSQLLTSHDWDGVNVAELYFEPDVVPEDFTPFHPSIKRRFPGDPVRDRERFLDFRTDLVVELNDQFLRSLNGLPNAAELDFQLTVIDDRLDPELGRLVGSDIDRLAEVAKANGASLQVEDPFTQWAKGPLRYEGLADEVAGLLPGGQAFIDVNVVERAGARPTSVMTGTEFALAVMAAARPGRLGLFSAGTIPAVDLHRLPGAMAGMAEVFDTGVRAPWTVTVSAPDDRRQARLDVDGEPWPTGAGHALIPPGEHRLTWSGGRARGPGLLRLTAEIGIASVEPDALTFSYDARVRPLAVLDRAATGITIDGEADELVTEPGSDARVVRLPSGTHSVRITTDR